MNRERKKLACDMWWGLPQKTKDWIGKPHFLWLMERESPEDEMRKRLDTSTAPQAYQTLLDTYREMM